jgi:hypothetical protein
MNLFARHAFDIAGAPFGWITMFASAAGLIGAPELIAKARSCFRMCLRNASVGWTKPAKQVVSSPDRLRPKNLRAVFCPSMGC